MSEKKILYHKVLLDMIDKFKRPKWGKFVSKDKTFNGRRAYFKPFKKEFKVKFSYNVFSTRRKLDVGQMHKNISIQFGNQVYDLEDVFLGNHSMPHFTGSVSRIHTKGFSETSKYYYRVVIPLERELELHYKIEETRFTTDLGYYTRTGTTATLAAEPIKVCCIHRNKTEHFLVIDSPIKQNFDEFAEKSNAVKVGLGYLTGFYTGNQGYFFAYTAKDMKTPKHFRCVQFRNSMKSGYSPITSNAYSYLHRNPLAKKYYPLLRTVSLQEFSLLCEKIYNSLEFSSTLVLMLESSVASLLFMPGGYAIALETMSDLIIGSRKLKLAPIKDKALSKNIRKQLLELIEKECSSIAPDDLKVLRTRVEQINQTTNKARLRAPFELLGITLLEEDLKVLETRNDFLHGRVPDLTGAGKNRTTDRINKDLYYASMRFYTLLNMLILKWIGYDNRVINFPKIHEGFTGIALNEEPYRSV